MLFRATTLEDITVRDEWTTCIECCVTHETHESGSEEAIGWMAYGLATLVLLDTGFSADDLEAMAQRYRNLDIEKIGRSKGLTGEEASYFETARQISSSASELALRLVAPGMLASIDQRMKSSQNIVRRQLGMGWPEARDRIR